MSELKQLFESANIPEEKIKTMAEQFVENPMGLVTEVQEMGLPPDFMQKAMAIVMANPQAVIDFAESLGLSEDLIEEGKARMAALMS